MSDSEDTPNVVDLNKQDNDDESNGEENSPTVAEQAKEGYNDLDSRDGDVAPGGNPNAQQRDNYPEAVNEEDDEDPQAGSVYGQARQEYGFDPEEAQKAFTYNEYGLSSRFDEEKGFSHLERGDMVVIDTPMGGGKTGEVTDVDETWSGTLKATVDTGANKYELTPFEDEYSEKFVACVSDAGEMSDEMLGTLGKVSVKDVDVGTQVMLDVPNVGPTRGMVQEKKTTRENGEQIIVNTGPVAFDVYEDPSPTQKKEQPFLVGRISN